MIYAKPGIRAADHPVDRSLQVRPQPAGSQRLPLIIFCLFTAFYLLTMSGHMYVSDEETMYLVTRRLLLDGDVALEVERGAPVATLRRGPDGRRYAPYGIVPSLLALPFFWLGTLMAAPETPAFEYTTRLAVSAVNAPVTAATVALLVAWALRLGFARWIALTLALLYGLATFAWPYARTFLSEPLAALLLLIAVERADAVRDARCRYRPLLLSGLAAGLLIGTRIAAGITLPIIGLYVIWPHRWCAGRQFWATLRSILVNSGWWLIGFGPGVLPLVWYNLIRAGSVLASGYGGERKMFINPLLEGVYGLLFSPGKSVFLYAPPVLLAIPGALLLWRRRPGLVLVIVALFLAHVGFYARWNAWSGGAWGPRFLLPPLPLMLLLAGAVLHQRAGWLRHVGYAVTGLLGGLGLIGALGGVLVNFDTYLNMSIPEYRRIYEPRYSPLLVHWQLLADRVARYAHPPPYCALGRGFFAPEQADRLLPRRTGASAYIDCNLEQPALLSLSLNDGRPPDAPASDFWLHLSGRAVDGALVRQARVYRLLLPPGHGTLGLTATTWNPRAVGFSDRDADLGIVLTGIYLRTVDGSAVSLIDRAIAPFPTSAGARFAWYYERHNQHLIDHWAWYLAQSALPLAIARTVTIAICMLVASFLVAAGVVSWNSVWRFRSRSNDEWFLRT